MGVDPLAEFREGGQAARAPAMETGGGSAQGRAPRILTIPEDGEEYVAYKGADRQRFLTVCGRTMWRRPQNSGLKDVADDAGKGTYLCLLYADNFAIVLTGRNLLHLAEPLSSNAIEWILEYDPDRWPLPKDKSAPIIEKMDFFDADTVEAIVQHVRAQREKPRQKRAVAAKEALSA